MEFKAVKDAMGLTIGNIYAGSIVAKDVGDNDVIRIVVFNDNGKWHAYQTFFFEPA